MINNFYGGVKETPSEPVSIAMGCGCTCNCPNHTDLANSQTTSAINLACQPFPKFIWPELPGI